MTSAPIWQPAYIGIGSNLSEPRAQVLGAFDRIAAIEGVRLVVRSRLYGSSPLGPADQPDYVNAVAGVLTLLTPQALLSELHALERAAGRPAKRERWGPRILDLDLLVYGRERSSEGALTLPHPGILERAFVLYPLADVAPDLDVPGMGRVAALKQRVAAQSIRLLDAGEASADSQASARTARTAGAVRNTRTA
ncbi:MAG TPA: 2-amino-4-hydroxy-6-hydroxymethyldihydropteridine diphosphokinase [Steroidobacteraceae bacterium]|nr:2-amino-4-hydroxy-6-hydroxymethyldihydropteridine diphosphokinase [Steroidobacteraceae bacterium]